jgi:hypothetical protein
MTTCVSDPAKTSGKSAITRRRTAEEMEQASAKTSVLAPKQDQSVATSTNKSTLARRPRRGKRTAAGCTRCTDVFAPNGKAVCGNPFDVLSDSD